MAGKAGLTLRKILETIERQMGSPITETVVLQRDASGKFSVKSGTYGADGSYHGETGSLPHPQQEMLEAILNGTDKKHPQLVAEVKAMLGEVDALYEESIGYEKELAALQGKDPPPYDTALDKWLAMGDCHMCIPMKTAQAGRDLAKSHQAEFARFRNDVSGAGLTEDQVYSRFFAQYATHVQLMAAVERAQAEQDALV
ncbi:MAG: hypothetical protein H7Y60_03150 [Rhodospirillaceae bacterium]|nr:hypothetical protein [Rhodospirillales bacterium]